MNITISDRLADELRQWVQDERGAWPEDTAYQRDLADLARQLAANTCRKCGAEMQHGKALAQTIRGGSPDLGGDVMTFSAGGPGQLIDCWKCPACGWSVSK